MKTWSTHELRSSATISDEELVLAINHYRQLNNSTNHNGRLPTSKVWVFTYQLAEHFNIHPNRISSKLRRTYRRKLTDGGGVGLRGDITLKIAGESLLRGREYKVTWCGIKKTHFAHSFLTSNGEELECNGYEVGYRSKHERDEEFEFPENEDSE